VLAAANDAIAEATTALEAYRFDEYASACYRFTWNTYCDWFLELAKPALAAPDSAEADEVRQTAAHVLGIILRLLHPAIPYVTEELWDQFGYGAVCSLIKAPWPEPGMVDDAPAARAELDWLVRLIGEVRTVRAEMNVPPSQKAPVLLKDAPTEALARGGRWIEAIGRMARASEFGPLAGEVPHGSAQTVLDGVTIVIPLAGIIDLGAERVRLQKDKAKALSEADKISRKLDNADFVARAPDEVVDENRDRLQAARDEASRLEAALQRIT
jgi:valyl-tRNA synthetase